MFESIINKNHIKEIEDFMNSEDCNFVQQMSEFGMSFQAMAFVVQAIFDSVKAAKKQLEENDG